MKQAKAMSDNCSNIPLPVGLGINHTPQYKAERTGPDVPEMFSWYLAVSPLDPPDTSEGGIALVESARDRAANTAMVGALVSIGPLAFCSTTRGGLDMRVQRESVKLMDFLLFPAYVGQRTTLKDGTKLIFLKDIEIMGKVDDPELYAVVG